MTRRGFVLIVLCVLALAAGTTVVSRGEPRKESSKADLEKELQRLLHERLVSAESEMEATQAALEAERIDVLEYLPSANRLIEARLALADTPAKEIELLEERVKLMQLAELRVKTLYDLGTRGGEAREYFAAKQRRASAQIAVVKARLKAAQ